MLSKRGNWYLSGPGGVLREDNLVSDGGADTAASDELGSRSHCR